MQLPERDFYFLRHGQTEYNRDGRFQGKVDIPLNDTGLQQAETVIDALHGVTINRIISSPATRVKQTIQPYQEKHNLPVQIEKDLMEFYVGSFEGEYIRTILDKFKLKAGDSWLSVMPEDAESWDDFVPRVCAAVRHWTGQYPEETLLFAAHGLVFRALTEALTGTAANSLNAASHHFKRSGDGWAVSTVPPDNG